MALSNYSKFYYVTPVTEDNFALAFTENDIDEIVASVEIGRYTVTELGLAIQDALNTFGDNSYEVEFDRQTRKYTITSDDNFKILAGTSPTQAVGIYELIGFNLADTAFTTVLESNNEVGSVFAPVFYLQDFKDSSNNRGSISGVKNVSASGQVEVVKFGNQRFIEFDVRFQTNGLITGYPFKTDNLGVDNLRDFMEFVTEIYPIEFMVNDQDLNNFKKLLLESTASSNEGLGFDLRERYDLNLPNFFDSGNLKFRLIE